MYNYGGWEMLIMSKDMHIWGTGDIWKMSQFFCEPKTASKKKGRKELEDSKYSFQDCY